MQSRLMVRQQKFHKKQLLFVGFLLLALAGLFVGKQILNYWQKSGRPSTSDYPVLGVSLSQTDGYQDFHLLKKHGIDFVYLKATQGADYFDDAFLNNYWRIQGAQLPFGIEHYFSWQTSPKAQFTNIKASVGNRIGTLPLVLQVKAPTASQLTVQQIDKSVSRLQSLLVKYYQRPVLIQTDPALNDLIKRNSFGGILQTRPHPIKGNQVKFWQYTNAGRIPSLATANQYSLLVFNGNQQQWAAFLQTGGW